MTDISKEAADALLQGVTGPRWEILDDGEICIVSPCGDNDEPWYIARMIDGISAEADIANARFIATARELVPAQSDKIETQAAEIAALRAALDEAEDREAALLATNEINRETLLRHNADCDRRIRKAEAERDAANAAARIAHDALWELNPNNYDHDEVCKVNDGSVEAMLTLAPIIGETHGKPPEWWAERAAHLGAKP